MANRNYILLVDPYIEDLPNLIKALKKHGFKLLILFSSFEATADLKEAFVDSPDFEKIFFEKTGYEIVLNNLRHYPITGVINGFDSGTLLSIKISNDLNLDTANPLTNLQFLGDKYLMGEYLKKFSLFPIKQINVTSSNLESSIRYAKENIPFPLFVKPTNSSTSFGITICYNEIELRKAINSFLNVTDMNGTFIDELVIQEFIEGPEYLVCSVSLKKSHAICALFTYRVEPLQNIELARSIDIINPYDPSVTHILDYAKTILDVTQFNSGPAATEIKIYKNHPCLIELNPRMAGLNVQDLIKFCTGTSQSELTALAFGDSEEFFKISQKPVELRAYGKILFLRNFKQKNKLPQTLVNQIQALASFKDFSTKFKPDEDILPITTDFLSTIANVLLVNEDYSQLEQDANYIIKLENAYLSQ